MRWECILFTNEDSAYASSNSPYIQLLDWMDESATLDCLDTVWGNKKGAIVENSSILVWDVFKAHGTENLEKRCCEMKTSGVYDFQVFHVRCY